MREIKFRGHTGATWVYGNLIQFKDSFGKDHAQIEETVWDDFGCWDVDPESVGQFTGLKDRKGVEIFEGDILMIHNPPNQIQRMELICTVKYLPGAWYAIVRKTNIWDHYRVERLEKGYEILLVNIADEKPIRIIGNTFENPNLI
jgi:uncharacterized phage protein (TIGR01671 family)